MVTTRSSKPANFLGSIVQRFSANQVPTATEPPREFDPSTDPTFTKADTPAALFTPTDPAVDGEDCLHDCDSCTIKYPRSWNIEEEDQIYGHVGGWDTHIVVATGKTDWVRDVTDEVGSVMEAIGKADVKPSNGVRQPSSGFLGRLRDKVADVTSKDKHLMLSASDMPVPHDGDHDSTATDVLLLPAWQLISGVTPALVPDLIANHVNNAPTNTTPLPPASTSAITATLSGAATMLSDAAATLSDTAASLVPAIAPILPSPHSSLSAKPCPHSYLILLCSQKTRDARCGQSAPLLRRELERHLRPLGLYRDLHDERPGGCGIYFISHVGGHKYAANVMVFRRSGSSGTQGETALGGQSAQGIWLGRVRPEDCENIVKYTVLQGKVVKPESQLRGGYDRTRGLTSW